MSLINDMLNDLEARRANDLKRTGLQNEVRPLPRMGRDGEWTWRLLWIALLCLVGGAVAWYYLQIPKAVIPVPPVVVAPSPPEPVQAPVVEAAPVLLPLDQAELRPATVLANPPVDAKVVSTTTQAVVTTTTIAAVATSTMPAAKVAQPPASKPTVEAAGAIDRRVVYVNPREKLEGDVRNAAQLAAAGKSNEAAELLREVLRQDPLLTTARQALLRILLEQRKAEEMMAVLGEGLDHQANQTGWAVSLARLWVERGDYAAAQRVLARSYPHASANPDYLGFYAHVHFRQNHYAEARELYQMASRIAPGEGRWWLGQGLALEAESKAGEAREAFRRALATGSLNADLAALAEQKLR